MSEAKFTSGEWKVSNNGETLKVKTGDQTTVCQLTFLKGAHGMKGRKPEGEAKANAHLIAAAPDMYEALKLLVKFCDLYQNEKVIKNAEAALAKAQGE